MTNYRLDKLISRKHYIESELEAMDTKERMKNNGQLMAWQGELEALNKELEALQGNQ